MKISKTTFLIYWLLAIIFFALEIYYMATIGLNHKEGEFMLWGAFVLLSLRVLILEEK